MRRQGRGASLCKPLNIQGDFLDPIIGELRGAVFASEGVAANALCLDAALVGRPLLVALALIRAVGNAVRRVAVKPSEQVVTVTEPSTLADAVACAVARTLH